MPPKHKGSSLPAMIIAAMILSIGPGLARGQSKDIEGNWCHLEQGCTHWSALYTIEADKQDADRIRIRYRDTDFFVFDGTIKKKDSVEWTIEGKLEGTGRESGERLLVARASVTDRIKGTITESRVEGVLVKKILLPFEGTLEGVGELIKKGTEISMSGNVVGKIDAPGGGDIMGTFDGALKKKKEEKLIIDGSYTPPPAKCSGPRGKNRTQKQADEQRDRLAKGSERRVYAEAREVSPAEFRQAQKQGSFVRVVEGTISSDNRTITLDLPTLPVLDHKCAVQEKVLPPGQLKLVKQDAVAKAEK